MKKVLATALVATLGFAALAPNQASAADGTINITGTINSSTCKINGGSSPVAVNVTLPTVSTTALSAAGQTAGRTAFALNLSGCGSLTKAQTFFEPGQNIMADGNLKNATGTATGVEVQLLNASDFTQVNLAAATAASQSPQIATLTGGAGSLNYYAQYYTTAAGGAGAGSVATTVQFTMLYQ